MSNYSTEQIGVVQSYIDDHGNNAKRESLKSLLQSASVEDKLHLLKNVEGLKPSSFNILHMASRSGHLDVVKSTLRSFKADRILEVERIQTPDGYTAFHLAAHNGHSEVVRYLLNQLTEQQRADVLKLQDADGCTALHRAAIQKRTKSLQLMISLVRPEQQGELLNMKNNKEQSVLAVTEPDMIKVSWTVQALDDVNKKLTNLEKSSEEELKKLQKEKEQRAKAVEEADKQVGELKRDKQKQDTAIEEMNKAVTVGSKQTEELVEKNKQLEIQNNQQARELKDAQEKVKTLQDKFVEQEITQQQISDRCSELERQKLEQTQTIGEQTKEIGEQKDLLSNHNDQLTDMKEQLESQKDQLDEDKQTQLSLSVRCDESEEINTHLAQALEETNDKLEELKRNKIEQEEALEQTNKAVVASSEQIKQLEEKNKELERENHLQAKALLNLGNEFTEQRRLTERETNQRAEEMDRMRVRQEEMQRLIDHLHIYLRIEDQELEELDEQ